MGSDPDYSMGQWVTRISDVDLVAMLITNKLLFTHYNCRVHVRVYASSLSTQKCYID